MNPNSPVTESINERVLKLLGLEETFDLDYETYVQLLKERLIRVTASGEKLPKEDFDLLRQELKRVKTKETKNKKFKIQSDSFLGNKKQKQTKPKITAKKLLLPSSGALSRVSEVESKSKITQRLQSKDVGTIDIVSKIDEKLSSILDTLSSAYKLQNKKLDTDRKERDNKKRQERENRLESGKKLVGTAVQKILAPFQNIFERVWNFIKFTLLGRAFTMLMNWFADPKNKGKVETLGRFLKDWWPALIGAYGLFMTPFGGLVRTVVGTAVKWTFQITKFAIPKLLKVIKSPAGIGLGLLTAGATIPKIFPGTVDQQERKTAGAPGSKEEKIKQLELQKANLNVLEKLQGKGAEIDEQLEYLKTGKTKSYGFVSGGFVSGDSGIDKVPAMLSDGEFVMSRGAVSKFGTPFLEALNAAGGGTNKPKIVKGVPHAYGGGPIGSKRDNGLGSIKKFIKQVLGYDVDRPRTWGPTKSSSSDKNKQGSGGLAGTIEKSISQEFNKRFGNYNKPKSSKVSTGSLLTDPIGAMSRVIGEKNSSLPQSQSSPSSPSNVSTGSLLTDPAGAISRMMGKSLPKSQQSNKKPPSGSKNKSGEKGFFKEIQEKLSGPGASTYRDAGSVYARQMFGGIGGPVSERDLSKDSQQELQKAIQRAKKRTGSEISKAEAKIKELRAQGAKDGNPALETQKSFLKKLKSGGIRVQYTDYTDEKGNISESAKNAKNILGQFWATERSKKEGGGYRVEDKYDFDMLKTKDPKTGNMRDMNTGELISQGVFGKGKTIQQRLQAAYLLNPLRGKGDVDMVLGGKRTAAESLGLTGSKTLLGGLLGVSGKPKDKNTQALEAKRPWWDKMGMFGGASAQMARDQKAKQEFTKNNPSAKLYNKPQANTGQPYQSKFAQPKASTAKPKPKPAAKPSKPAAKPQRAWYDPRGWVGKQGGGYVDEGFGMNIAGGTADRQLAALQPGEYILPVDVVNKLGSENLNRLVAAFDSNSTPAKLGYKSNNVPNITPYSPTSSSMTLPPIKSSSGGSMSTPMSSSNVPDFSVIPADSVPFRTANAKLLGLVA